MSARMSKVDSVIARVLSTIIIIEHSHESFGIITVAKVKTSTDLKNCTVYVTSTDSKENLAKYLNRLAPKLQHTLAEQISIKRIPKLFFKYDDSSEYLSHISSLIEKVEKEIK